jgi:hypothetical protein
VLLRFLQSIHDRGRAELGQPDHDPLEALWRAGKEPEEARSVQRMLGTSHAQAVLDFPGSGIEFHPEAAIWGAILLFRAAFLTSFREIEGSEIAALLQAVPMPDGANPSAHFSADLSLRHWPALYRMARARSEDDPLVKSIHELAGSFPLSSLGMNIGIRSDSPVLRHAGLRQFFAERALELADHAGLSVPEIADYIRSKLGAYSAILDRGLLLTSTES